MIYHGCPRIAKIIKMDIDIIKKQCEERVTDIFDDISRKGLIDQNSEFFGEARKRVGETCFWHLQPLQEYLYDFKKINGEYFSQYFKLFAASFFWDFGLDLTKASSSTRIRALHISNYLLIKYFSWLEKTKKSRIITSFWEFYARQSHYLITEKKWQYPQEYAMVYRTHKKIFLKEVMLLFPFELLSVIVKSSHVTVLKKMFINYYSFILLVDDIVDLQEDIDCRCLTYPIMFYFKSTGKLPKSAENALSVVVPCCVKILSKFKRNMKACERYLGKQSIIIENKITSLENELKKGGIRI